MKRLRNTVQIVYVSAIAHKLSAQFSVPAPTIATYLGNRVLQDTDHPLAEWVDFPLSSYFWQDIRVRVLASGLIQFDIGDRAIAAWLDWLIKYPPQLPGEGLSSATLKTANFPDWSRNVTRDSYAKIFAIQHAHARCCSLLRLAHQEGLITLNQLDAPPHQWCFVEPEIIPWLGDTVQLALNQPSEARLIGQLVTVVDDLSNGVPIENAKHWLQLAGAVSEGFHTFHRDRPLWEYNTKTMSAQVSAQLGLIMATQRVLRLLLEDLLGICAPITL